MTHESPQSLGELLRRSAQQFGDQPFLRTESKTLTFEQAHQRVGRLANLLANVGVTVGSKVAVMLHNGIEFPLTWLALAECGAVIVPLNPAYGENDLKHVLNDAGVDFIVSDVDRVGAHRKRWGGIRPAMKVLCWGNDGIDALIDRQSNIIAISQALETHSPVFARPVSVDRDTLLNLQYTSGTTGFPKGCMLTHGYWLALAERAGTIFEIRHSDVAYTCQPFYYMDPQWNTAMCLTHGIPLFIDAKFSASRFWQTIQQQGITLFYCIGTMPVLLFKQPANPAVEQQHRMRVVFCSGIYPDLHAAFEQRWAVPWREVFGMTETGVDFYMPIAETASVGSGCIGYPAPGKQAQVVDEQGVPVADGESGELTVAGSPMMQGYWRRPEDTANTIREGWLHTGDIAAKMPNGAYKLVGRLKDMIRRGGENIAAAEVEATLCGNDAVLQAAVVAVKDSDVGEEAHAYVRFKTAGAGKVTSADNEKALQALHEFAAAKLAKFKVPRYWSAVESFPMTASERIAKHRLKEPAYQVERFDMRAAAHVEHQHGTSARNIKDKSNVIQ
jgi:acyl-CoA synthetase (AMP-forming)/AMP-acid ligase II